MSRTHPKLNGSVERLASALREVIREAIAETENRIEPKLDNIKTGQVQLAKSIKELDRKSQNRHKDALTRITKIGG